ncbi:Cytochrome b-c1 complex subunit Rieske-1, mitochondrial [Vitis vinifera]|uniref:Cytochrome b-c1 complex subunit Rieske-1, mitochondrial n=1 Tax=Vitis vinifera TaxID=29760 RepID=A0A438D172_VITVI|nr:Cytochrome b-c1 complex subunit Rieske-1, mitochondrial [Vitis vinifera]
MLFSSVHDIGSPCGWLLCPGFSSESLAPSHDLGMISDLPPTVAALKNPTSKIVYDDHNHERFPLATPASVHLPTLY